MRVDTRLPTCKDAHPQADSDPPAKRVDANSAPRASACLRLVGRSASRA